MRFHKIIGHIGQRASAVSCLIYDKTYEIRYHAKEKDWFRDLWLAQRSEDGLPTWDGEAPVWRIEIRFKRQALHKFDFEDVYEVLARIPDLWAYAAGHIGGYGNLPDGWLRYVIPSNEDVNRSRWPVHPCWQVIQGAFLHSAPSVVVDLQPLQRQCKRKVNMQRALAAVAGYTSTMEAWRREPGGMESDISDTFHFLYQEVTAYLEEKGRDFEKDVQKKRVLYGPQAVA